MSKKKVAPKVTPWFPGNVKPARPGVYEREFPGGSPRNFARWSGRHWGPYDWTPAGAADVEPDKKSAYQLRPEYRWRGLSSNQEGTA